MVLLEVLARQSRVRQLLLAAGAAGAAYAAYRKYASSPRDEAELKKRLESIPSEYSKKKVAVDREFLREFFILVLHTCFLVSRTLVSIYVAQLDGSIVKSIVDRKLRLFVLLMCKWMAVAVPATYINSMIAFLESKLSIAFRTRLVKHLYDKYMADEIYFRVGNLDSRLANPDQCLTDDVAAFCTDLAHLYSHLSKPMLDVVLMTAQLIMLHKSRADGKDYSGRPILLATLVIGGTGWILKLATPPFGKLVAEQARRYGELRAVHSRVITHSEEIAFYGGHEIERNVLNSTYDSLVRHINYIYRKKIWFTMLEQFCMRYMWGACGMVMIAIPAFARHYSSMGDALTSGKGDSAQQLAADTATDNVSTRTQDFVTSRGLLVSAADAIERMMSSWKEITELAGRTARLYEMIDIFDQVKRGVYVKTQTTATITEEKEGEAEATAAAEGESPSGKSADGGKGVEKSGALISVAKKRKFSFGDTPAPSSVGVVHDNSSYIELVNVPVVTPNGDMLLKEPGLTFTIRPGQHLLITGPNGCGKSSLFRMLGGLWPVRGGVMRRPGKSDIFLIPQRPYLTKGRFRDQFLYPHTSEQFFAAGHTDEDLRKILDIVALNNVVEREGGLDAENDWRDVLSGGEKQRVAMARVLYFKPHFAILDECTSAVSIDVEGRMYRALIESGITLLTVTHRPTLWRYHTHILQFDGQGNYVFREMHEGETQSNGMIQPN